MELAGKSIEKRIDINTRLTYRYVVLVRDGFAERLYPLFCRSVAIVHKRADYPGADSIQRYYFAITQ